MGIVAERIQWQFSEVEIAKAKYFFSTVSVETSAMEFSYQVHRVCDSKKLLAEQKVTILTHPVRYSAHLLTLEALSAYLGLQRDPVLLNKLLDIFDSFKPALGSALDDVLEEGSPELWNIRAVFSALRTVSPDDLPEFGRLVREKFPNIPLGVEEYVKELTAPDDTVPVVERTSVVLENVRYMELLKLPRTNKNRRKLRAFFRTAAAR